MHGMNLMEWMKKMPSEEERRELLLNLDIALKYLNDRGMMVTSFNPNDIEIVDNNIKQIMFNKVDRMNDSADLIITNNIYEEAKLAMSIYLNYFDGFNDNFLRNNFDEFIFALPPDDVNYYKGIIVRGSSVYFSEFDLEKRKRDLSKLEEEIKQNDDSQYSSDMMNMMTLNNDSINNKLYSKIFREGAYANTFVLPIGILLLGLIICITSIILYFFGL